MGNTAKTLAMAAALTLSAAANAAVNVISAVDTPLSFNATIDYAPQNSFFEFYSANGNWSANVSFVPIGGGLEVVAGSMVHLVGPHTGELAPNPAAFGFAFIVTVGVAAPPSFAATIPHTVGPHSDSFSASIGAPIFLNPSPQVPLGYYYPLTLSGSHPVPEPQQFAVLAGLGLLGFGVYRRMRS
ncbi:MAG TPA: hypothetical protein PKM43_18470 [Verrucomicrobiota bacterium]|nr:hypothetical protein [Verrucomicrobiota bacterium]